MAGAVATPLAARQASQRGAARWWWALVGAYAAVVFVFSILPVGLEPEVPHLDKVIHLCEYAVFAWLLTQAIHATAHPPHVRFYLLWAWLYATSYGALMEVVQLMVPWRSADWLDAVANALGAALGAWIGRRT